LSTPNTPLQVILQISSSPELGSDELDQLTRQLLGELQEVEIESASLIKEEETPEGAKSVEAVTLGSMAVAVLPAFFPKLIEFLQAWALRGQDRNVKVKTQVGERSVEVEYSPDKMSKQELMDIIDVIMTATEDK
jgi:hypothetical protein